MKWRTFLKMIEQIYAGYGVYIRLLIHEVMGNICIYKVKLGSRAKESDLFRYVGELQLKMHLELFRPFREGLSLFISISERQFIENGLMEMLDHIVSSEGTPGIPIPLGYDLMRKMRFADLTLFPHALYAGATNSGKTVALQCLVVSLVAVQPVSDLNIIIIDTGANGLDVFQTAPHLSHPIVKDAEIALDAIRALLMEMEHRKGLPTEELELLPVIVCVVDEYISLIQNVGGVDEQAVLTSALSSLLQRGRHFKIHMVLATQEAAKKDMKINLNNINARFAFSCSDYYNSLSILGESGAEKLFGQGVMMFKSSLFPTPLYLQSPFISDTEIEQILHKVNLAPHDMTNKFVIPTIERFQLPIGGSISLDMPQADVYSREKELATIILWALKQETISVNRIKREFRIGNRADNIVEEMCQLGIVTKKFANQPRKILPYGSDDLSPQVLDILLRNKIDLDNVYGKF